MNISIFDQNFDFRPKFRFSTKISIVDQNFDFRPKFRFSTKISIFDQNFDFSKDFLTKKTANYFKLSLSLKVYIFHSVTPLTSGCFFKLFVRSLGCVSMAKNQNDKRARISSELPTDSIRSILSAKG